METQSNPEIIEEVANDESISEAIAKTSVVSNENLFLSDVASTPQFKNPASPYTALKDSVKEGVGGSSTQMRFFGPRFMTIWVMPIAITGIVMEFLFVAPLRNLAPFS